MRNPLNIARCEKQHLIWLGALLCVGCTDLDEQSHRSSRGALGVGQEEQGAAPGNDALSIEDLDCPRGGSTAPIAVAFDCDEITVVSCKDLSNVVLELADGSHQRFEGLTGHRSTFAGRGVLEGSPIVGVWVKAGANHSGDGPGYGQRFDAPEDGCEPDGDPPAENPPSELPPSDQPPTTENPPGNEAPPSEPVF